MNNFKKAILTCLAVITISAVVMAITEAFKLSTTVEKDYRSTPIKEVKYVDESFRLITKFTYEDHDYISFIYKGGTAQIVHDPNCRKCKLINN